MHTPSTSLDLTAMTSRLALAAAAMVGAMFTIFVFTGIGQDPLQYIHPSSGYTEIALRNPPMLRTAIGLDNAFIVLYSSMFLVLCVSLWDRAQSRALLITAVGLLALTGLMDLFENMHFLTIIASALQGLTIGQDQIVMQVWESLVKFHVSYLGLFLLGYSLPNETTLEKVLCFSLRWIQLPVGLLIYLTPESIATPLVMVRFAFFLFSLLAIAIVFRRQKGDLNAQP